MKIIIIKTVLALVLPLSMLCVHAGTLTGNFNSAAKLSPSCTVSAINMNFGTISPAPTGEQNASSTVTVLCSKGTAYSIGLNEGSAGYINYSGQWSYVGYIRIMNNTTASASLMYNIFKDAAHTQVFGGPNAWGQSASQGGQGTAVMVNKIGTGAQDVTNLYGVMSSNQFVQPGTYTDTIPVVVNF